MRTPEFGKAGQIEANAEMAQNALRDLGQPDSLLNRLHHRRRQLERELWQVNNSIQFVEKNAAIVEAVEIVLTSQGKCDPRPF